ncbi:hypothetical protein [Leptospira brenneri]|uniref:hypothetical protein n=1 Tax=Leptospira brenneri TaxID=2023182 RepID=UPI000C2A3478|nr:hypothetical protein [Leptospira brenneri]PJZ43651.1 hypothetical protein CH361_19390 [Leptospira brenneri]
MSKTLPFFLLVSSLFILSCNDKETQKEVKKERITWIKKYIKETELLNDKSKKLIDKASFYYQKEILTGVAEPEDVYSKNDKALLMDFLRNTIKRLKIKKFNESIAIINTYDFGNAGEISKVDHLWIKKNEEWVLFELEGDSLPYSGQKIYIEELKNKKGKFLILHGGCCDTDSLAILEISKNQTLEPIYTGTQYGSSYKFIRKNGKLEILEKDMEDNFSEISLEPR